MYIYIDSTPGKADGPSGHKKCYCTSAFRQSNTVTVHLSLGRAVFIKAVKQSTQVRLLGQILANNKIIFFYILILIVT